jgi:hypothetical protein
MAQAGTVEIQVELDGAGKAEKSLNALGKSAQTAASGFSQVGDALSDSSNRMASTAGAVSSSIGSLTTGIAELSTASKLAGAGFTAMLGPLATVGTALVGVIYTVTQYINSSNNLEERLQALRMGASEFTQTLEQLADAQVKLTEVEQLELLQLSKNAQSQTEYVQLLREGEGVFGKRLARAQKATVLAQEELDQARKAAEAQRVSIRLGLERNQQLSAAARAHAEQQAMLRLTADARNKLAVAQRAEAQIEKELLPLIKEASEARRVFTKRVDELTEARGRSAREAAERERLKLIEEIAQQLKALGALQITTEAEAAQATLGSAKFQLRQLELQQQQRISQVRALEAAQIERINRVAAAEKAALLAQARAGEVTYSSIIDKELAVDRRRAEQQERLALDRELAETLIIESAVQRRKAIRRAAHKERQARAAQMRASAEANERAELMEAARLEEAKIRLYLQGEEQRIALIELRHNTAQALAQTEAQREIASLNRQRELLDVERKRAEQQERTLATIAQLLERNTKLQADLNREIALMTEFDFSPVIDAMAAYGEGTLYAAVNAAFAGESIKAAVGEALRAVAIQATVQGLMETAKGVSALFTGAPSIGFFKAAGMYATAAAIAGSAGAALSGGGGGARSGGGGGASPSGAAQRAPQQQRDRDEDRAPITINVNMGNATIYDTRAAAERAFADRVVSAINTPRRGAVRLRRA